MRRFRLAGVAIALLTAWGAIACTEDPKIDRVGGSGPTTPDSGPVCDVTPADAAPRPFPCDVQAVIHAKCQRCHNSEPVLDRCYQAKTCVRGPFPLLSWSDTHALYSGMPIFQLMHQAIASDYMPFKATTISPPVEPLDSAEKQLLLAWTLGCAPAGSTTCSSTDAGDASKP